MRCWVRGGPTAVLPRRSRCSCSTSTRPTGCSTMRRTDETMMRSRDKTVAASMAVWIVFVAINAMLLAVVLGLFVSRQCRGQDQPIADCDNRVLCPLRNRGPLRGLISRLRDRRQQAPQPQAQAQPQPRTTVPAVPNEQTQPPPGWRADVAALRGRVSELEERPACQCGNGKKIDDNFAAAYEDRRTLFNDLADLSKRVDKLAKQPAGAVVSRATREDLDQWFGPALQKREQTLRENLRKDAAAAVASRIPGFAGRLLATGITGGLAGSIGLALLGWASRKMFRNKNSGGGDGSARPFRGGSTWSSSGRPLRRARADDPPAAE